MLQTMTFKPAISKRAHELPSRSVEELSEGDRLRRDCYLVSLTPFTFQNTTFTYEHPAHTVSPAFAMGAILQSNCTCIAVAA